ncbi:hypothetical protein [Aureimonas sp. SK2]|uniref:hypothetical protein n=1 Tax=Aureimonas sp. SK2 TaxID=3015992 RepID=UPI0024444817|nr:hypothetical protein [Aureimonas sp. SK2]
MSKTTPTIPDKYTPRQALRDREVLAAAIREKIQREKIATADIARRHTSIRAADIASIMRDDHNFGINRLHAIAEAIGLRARLVIS